MSYITTCVTVYIINETDQYQRQSNGILSVKSHYCVTWPKTSDWIIKLLIMQQHTLYHNGAISWKSKCDILKNWDNLNFKIYGH